MSRRSTTKTRSTAQQATHSEGPIDQCYRALLENSSSAILLLSPASIILGWNRGAETVAGWIADEALGRSFRELSLPNAFGLRGMQERASLLGGHFHIVGTSGVGTTAIASVPVAECFAP
ncbi:MAG TPA: PAS domain S-box protein [Nitrospiraceae bacterium]|nr:PAS domain S-box protein [Nitrospiraceae bacterium]